MNRRKTAIVLGGAGFLGSHVADVLSSLNYSVKIFDCYQSLYTKEGQEMIIGDIMNLEELILQLKGVDIVYHFAGMADIHEANQNPIEAVKHNILGTTNILEACIKNEVERFIFASTVYVYSEHGGVYRSCKQASELLIENYNKLYDLNFTILRFGSLYGKRANKFNWINKIIRQALKEGKMQREGNGEEVRDYIHVKDAAQSCVDMLDKKYENEYIMLTGSQRIKIKDLLIMINEILENKITIEYLNIRMEGHYETTPYTFRPKKKKKYMPDLELDLGQGMLNTIYDVYKEMESGSDEKIKVTLPD